MEKMVIVVECDVTNNDAEGFAETAEILDKLKPIFKDETGVKVYGAVKETATVILSILKGEYDGPEDLPASAPTQEPPFPGKESSGDEGTG